MQLWGLLALLGLLCWFCSLKSLALDGGLTDLLTYYILWLLEENASELKETISNSCLVEFYVGYLQKKNSMKGPLELNSRRKYMILLKHSKENSH
jgi:hypothetical protein